jgi:predicted permease
MLETLLQMTALIACGVAWQVIKPQGLDADHSRRVLTSLVYYLLLPALVLDVLWRAQLGGDTLRIALSAAAGVSAAFLLSWGIMKLWRAPSAVTGAVVLAAAFPNVTYLGLPLLDKALGEWARSVAIQYDLFACTPLLLSVGILFAQAHGDGRETGNPLAGLLKVPPLWAALAATALNLGQVPLPPWLWDWLKMLGQGVVPLMLIALGMSLRWDSLKRRSLPWLMPVIAVQMLFTPWLVWQVAHGLGIRGELLTAVVLEGAMPSMVLGLVVCDRYGLDTSLYAAAVSVTTLLSLLTIPFWFGFCGGCL